MPANASLGPKISSPRLRSLPLHFCALVLLATSVAEAQTVGTEAQRIVWNGPAALPIDAHFGARVEINNSGYGAVSAPDAGALQPMITVAGNWVDHTHQTGDPQTRAIASDWGTPNFTESVELGTTIRTAGYVVLEDLTGGSVQALATLGTLLVVGQPGFGSGGRVQIYRGSASTGFTLETSFLGLPNAELGASLAIDDEIVVAGAPGEGANGAVKVYADAGGWITLQNIDCPATSQSDAGFGRSLAISGGILAIGAPDLDRTITPGARTDIGGVYVYDVPFLLFELQTLLRPANGSHFDHVGTGVDLTSTPQGTLVLAMGIPGEDLAAPDGGAVATYDYDPATTTWRHTLFLVDSEADQGDALGHSVSASAYGVLAGAPNSDGNGVLDQGAAIYFDKHSAWIFADDFESGSTTNW